VLRLIRRPAYPGELNHEFVWPAAFLGSAVLAWGWFLSGCASNLVQLDLGQAFLFHPGFFLIVTLAVLWTIYSAVFWLRRDTLRLRVVVNPADSRRVRIAFVIVLVAHWAWQCYYLTR